MAVYGHNTKCLYVCGEKPRVLPVLGLKVLLHKAVSRPRLMSTHWANHWDCLSSRLNLLGRHKKTLLIFKYCKTKMFSGKPRMCSRNVEKINEVCVQRHQISHVVFRQWYAALHMLQWKTCQTSGTKPAKWWGLLFVCNTFPRCTPSVLLVILQPQFSQTLIKRGKWDGSGTQSQCWFKY